MTREEAIQILDVLNGDDPEKDHSVADTVLCDILKSLGYEDVVEKFLKIEKWYS